MNEYKPLKEYKKLLTEIDLGRSKLIKTIEALETYPDIETLPLTYYETLKEAKELIQALNFLLLEPETIQLSEKDYNKFIEALNNPPAPNEKLKKLFEE